MGFPVTISEAKCHLVGLVGEKGPDGARGWTWSGAWGRQGWEGGSGRGAGAWHRGGQHREVWTRRWPGATGHPGGGGW